MPKDQPHLKERSPGVSSSKNAKDKSNSATLLGMQETKNADNSSGRDSRCSSEKDSGYSDGSDCPQTDVEDRRSDKNRPRGGESTHTSQTAQNQECRQGNAANPTLLLAGGELQPIYIINNMVLTQPDTIQKNGQLLRRHKGSRPPEVLCQPPVLLPPTVKLHKPSCRKPNTTGKKVHGTYLPIYNSYPRIAPHPSKKPPEKSSTHDESPNQSKRVCTESDGESARGSRSLLEQHLRNKLSDSCSSSPGDIVSSSTFPTTSSTQGSTSTPGENTASSSTPLPPRGPHRNTSNARYCRFLNTVEILRQSGLLDITLRTKELLRQSNAAEQDIGQLRQHTELLCQAASDPARNPSDLAAWGRLHRAMFESGKYPNLMHPQNVQSLPHPDSSGQLESSDACDASSPLSATENSDVQLWHRPTALLDLNQNRLVLKRSEQSRKVACSGIDSFTPPDSSTG